MQSYAMSATVTTYSPNGSRVPPSDLQYECLHFMLRRASAQRSVPVYRERRFP